MDSGAARDEEAPGSSSEDNGALHDDGEPAVTTILRFLVTNTAAGSVIGKGGSTISDFQAQSGARIQLSRNHEYFPGTNDRVAVLNGTTHDVLAAFHLIMSKILKDTYIDITQCESKSLQVRLLVPKTVCGAIIGKGGSNIKKFVEDSQASIKLSSQDQLLPGVTDRIVTVSGTLDQLTKAVTLILTKLTDETNYYESGCTPLVYTAHNFRRNMLAYGPPSLMPRGVPVIAVPSPYPPMALGDMGAVMIGVPDEHIGYILGRSGRSLQEIQQNSGAKIKVSERGDFYLGTEMRKVTITGSADAIQAAQYLMSQKIRDLGERER